MLDKLDHQLAAFVQAHPRLMVLTGAGISTAAGLGDYRDKQGQWKRSQPITGQTFIHDEKARKRYWARSAVGWPAFSQASPTTAHIALQQLQQLGYARLLVTQNVDRLHQKAGHKDVIDLHGVLASVSCINCSYQCSRDQFQLELIRNNPWLEYLDARYAPDGDADLELSDIDKLLLPSCPLCQLLLKPDVVFFGETVAKPMVQSIMQQLQALDALLVTGSSLMVYSGFRFCKEAQRLGKPLAIVNDGITRADDMASLKVNGDCGERLTTLATQLQSVNAAPSDHYVST